MTTRSVTVKLLLLCCMLTRASPAIRPPASEGLNFALAFPPSDVTDSKCEVRILSKEGAQVVITDADGTDILGVLPGLAAVHTVEVSKIVTSGIEKKAFQVVSSHPVTIHIGTQTHSDARTPDQIFVRPLDLDITGDYEFYLVGYVNGESSYPFYMVTGSLTQTNVLVYDRSNVVVQDFTLGQDEVFTGISNITDFSGYRIVADKPVSVIAGNVDAPLGANKQYIAESVPTVDEIGSRYTTFPLGIGSWDNGYLVKIISAAANTRVEIPEFGFIRTLEMGEFATIDYLLTFYAFEVICSNPCYVYQMGRSNYKAGGKTFGWMGGFLAPLTPQELYTNDILFTTPYLDLSSQAMLSIVVSSYPVTGLYLDEENLEDLVWLAGDDDKHAVAALPLDANRARRLYTTHPTQRFSAYVYSTYHNPADLRSSKSFSIGHSGLRGSEGEHFILCLPPSNFTDTPPYITVTSDHNTNVVITIGSTNELFTISKGNSITYQLTDADRTFNGTEDKGIEITSGKPIAVYTGTSMHSRQNVPEDSLIRPINPSSRDNFYIISYLGSNTAASSVKPDAFYSITAVDVNTYVEVRRAENLPPFETITLERLQVYTRHEGNTDLTGYFINSTKPVSVIAGHGDVITSDGLTEDLADYICENMPSVDDLGSSYTTFPVDIGFTNGGYIARVLAVEQTTLVEVEEYNISEMVAIGNHIDIDHEDSYTAFQIQCSESCMVAQIIKSSPDINNVILARAGPTMTILTPNVQFSTDILFTSPWTSDDVMCMLAIVVQGSPVEDLFLNGEDLTILDWKTDMSDEYSYATVTIRGELVYRLYSDHNEQSFAGYVYSTHHDTDTLIAKGSTIGYGNYEEVLRARPAHQRHPYQ